MATSTTLTATSLSSFYSPLLGDPQTVDQRYGLDMSPWRQPNPNSNQIYGGGLALASTVLPTSLQNALHKKINGLAHQQIKTRIAKTTRRKGIV